MDNLLKALGLLITTLGSVVLIRKVPIVWHKCRDLRSYSVHKVGHSCFKSFAKIFVIIYWSKMFCSIGPWRLEPDKPCMSPDSSSCLKTSWSFWSRSWWMLRPSRRSRTLCDFSWQERLSSSWSIFVFKSFGFNLKRFCLLRINYPTNIRITIGNKKLSQSLR